MSYQYQTKLQKRANSSFRPTSEEQSTASSKGYALAPPPFQMKAEQGKSINTNKSVDHIDIEYIDENGEKQTQRYMPGMEMIGNTFADEAITALNGLIEVGADREGLISTLANDNTPVTISETDWNKQIESVGDVKWSPEGGLIHEDGKGRHSPAVSLIHELGHKYFQNYDPIGTQEQENKFINKEDYDGLDTYFENEKKETGGETGFKSYEEKWVIENVENEAAKTLGQSIRTSHGKSGKFKSKSVFSTESEEVYKYDKVRY